VARRDDTGLLLNPGFSVRAHLPGQILPGGFDGMAKIGGKGMTIMVAV
jgi:hypothetical protein